MRAQTQAFMQRPTSTNDDRMNEQYRLVDAGEEGYGMYIADSRRLSTTLDAEFEGDVDNLVDATITSPPYADVKNYEADEELQIGFGQSYDTYLEDLRDVYRQVYDVTKETGTLWVIVNTIKKDRRVVRLPFDIADVCENLHGVTECEECGTRLKKHRESGRLDCPECGWHHDPIEDSWRLQDIIVWDKNRARPWSRKGQLRNVFEYILCFSKADDFKYDLDSIRIPDTKDFEPWWVQYPERYNPRGKTPNNIWTFTTPTQGSWGDGEVDHPAPFPSGMVEQIINLTTDESDVVLDPFAGTGSVLAQAEAMERKPIGFELSDEYAEMYEPRRKEVADEWKEESIEARQEELERIICKLRQLKFPRELTRRVRKEIGEDSLEALGINTVFQLSHELIDREKFDEDNLLMESTTYFVLDDGVDHRQEIATAAVNCSRVPPCSKFGIKANIKVVTVSEMERILADSWEWPDELYLYADDRYNETVGTMSVSNWGEYVRPTSLWRGQHAKNGYPPILSNLQAKIPDPERTGETLSLNDIHRLEGENDLEEIEPGQRALNSFGDE